MAQTLGLFSEPFFGYHHCGSCERNEINDRKLERYACESQDGRKVVGIKLLPEVWLSEGLVSC